MTGQSKMIDNKYHDSRLYKITSRNQPQLVYIGSTFFTVEDRLKMHENSYNRYSNGKYHYVSSFDILKHGDYEITELCEVFCNSDMELRQEEQSMIDSIGPDKVVNKKKAYQNPEEKQDNDKQYSKQYYQNNMEKIKQHRNVKHNCDCGGKYTTRNKSTHFKSPKHKKFINTTN